MMLREKKSLAAIVAFILWGGIGTQSLAAPSGPKPKTAGNVISVKPQNLALYLRQKKVTAMLTNGSWLEGRVKEVTSDTIRMDVKKSAGDQIKKGENDIPLTTFASFSLKKTKGAWGRAVLTPTVGLLGATVGGLTGVGIGFNGGSPDSAGIGMGIGLALGLAGGYLAGYAIDHRDVVIMVEH